MRSFRLFASSLPVTIAIAPSAPATLYAGLDGAGVYRKTAATAWSAVNAGLDNLHVKALVIKPGDSTRLYAATYGGGVFTSGSSGDTWSVCPGQPTNRNVVSLVVDASGKLYAGTEAGVYVSGDGCGTWGAMNSVLP